MSKVIKNPTLFVDIDGTLVEYRKFSELSESILTPIQDVIDFVNNHYDNGSVVMITTARPSTYELFTKQELDLFHSTINTVAKQMKKDKITLDQRSFLTRYGHLRPGTYDISAPTYSENPNLYFNWAT